MDKQCVSENDILSNEAYDDFKTRSVRLKFGMHLLLGIGGAAIFGLFTAIAFKPAGAAGALMAVDPFLAVGLIVLGVVATYFGAKYMYENQILDQDFQAKKIAHAAAQERTVSRDQEVDIALPPPPLPSHVSRPGGFPVAFSKDLSEGHAAHTPETRIQVADLLGKALPELQKTQTPS